ncbi:hypothetical protein KEM52_004072, partial [Ascosphaera acerosa]
MAKRVRMPMPDELAFDAPPDDGEAWKQAVTQRQQQDMARRRRVATTRPVEPMELLTPVSDQDEDMSESEEADDVPDYADWADSEGQRLRDFGVDEHAEIDVGEGAAATGEDDENDDDD